MNDPDDRAPARLTGPLAALLAAHDADPDAAGPGAAARRAEVLALHAREPVAAPAALLAAARILVGGTAAAEVQLAQTFALRAMAAEPAARPVAARAFDRLRVLAGQPQKFGTEAGWPVDPTTTDSERTKWGLPSLADLRRGHGRGDSGSTS